MLNIVLTTGLFVSQPLRRSLVSVRFACNEAVKAGPAGKYMTTITEANIRLGMILAEAEARQSSISAEKLESRDLIPPTIDSAMAVQPWLSARSARTSQAGSLV